MRSVVQNAVFKDNIPFKTCAVHRDRCVGCAVLGQRTHIVSLWCCATSLTAHFLKFLLIGTASFKQSTSPIKNTFFVSNIFLTSKYFHFELFRLRGHFSVVDIILWILSQKDLLFIIKVVNRRSLILCNWF